MILIYSFQKYDLTNDVSHSQVVKYAYLDITSLQSIGTPRSAERRSGAALREAGARSERNSENCPGAQVGAQLRKRPER